MTEEKKSVSLFGETIKTFKLYETLGLDPTQRDKYNHDALRAAFTAMQKKGSDFTALLHAYETLGEFPLFWNYNRYGDQGLKTFKLYETLGLHQTRRKDYNMSDINAAFIKTIQDKCKINPDANLRAINDAWSILYNVDKKSIYDKRGDEHSDLDKTPVTF